MDGFDGVWHSYGLTVVSGPATEPIDLATAKQNSRVDHSDEDARFQMWIVAAREQVEQEAETAFINRTMELALADWPCDGIIRIPIAPVTSITKIEYLDADEVFQEIVAGDYRPWVGLGVREPIVRPGPDAFWPAIEVDVSPAIKVTFVAGYGATASVVPARAKQAMLMTIDYWWKNRGGEEAPEKFGLPEGAVRLIQKLGTQGYR